MNRTESVNCLVVDVVLHWFWYVCTISIYIYILIDIDLGWVWAWWVLAWFWVGSDLFLGYGLVMAWSWFDICPGSLGCRAGCPI